MLSYFELVEFAANHGRVHRSLEAAYRAVVDGLRRAKLPFLLHGAFAMAAYGHARATADLDLLVPADPAVLESLYRLMARLGAVPARPGPQTAADAIKRKPLHVSFNLSGWTFDFFPDPAFATLLSRATRHRFGGRTVRVISRADLLRKKRARGTLQDRADIEALEGRSG